MNDQNIPDQDKPEQDTKLENDTNMEVHKHPHHVMHKKKWTEYLLEFFMLFFAVFLGFIAENFREHIVERSKEREYIKLLIEDLQTDTAILHNIIPQMEQSVNGLDTLIDQTYLFIRGKADTRMLYYTYHHYCRTSYNLLLSERTLNQLKNSGSIRLIHDKDANNIISGAEVGFEQLREVTRSYRVREEDASNFGFKIFDFKEYLKANILANGTTNTTDNGFLTLAYQPPLNFTDSFYLKEFAARVGYFRNYFYFYVKTLENGIPRLEGSIKMLKNNYNF